MKLFRGVALLANLSVAFTAAQTAPPDIRGIYITTNDVSKLTPTRTADLQKALTIPSANGFYLSISWSAIEPARGQFDWTVLDTWLARAGGRRTDVVVLGGNSSPAWLYSAPPQGAGAVKLEFSYAIQGGKLGSCTPIVLAPPWDAAFLAEWDAMLKALSLHMKATGAYSNLAILRLSGINANTDELKLPQETPQGNGLACLSDAPLIWQQAGYRPSLILKAWDKITTSFQTYFPDKSYAIGLTESNAFPQIDESGAIVKGQSQEQTLPEVQLAAQKFGANLVALQTFLLPGMPIHQEIITAAKTLNSQAAFQTNEWLGLTGGAACAGLVTAPIACTPDTFISLVEVGIYPLGKSDPLRGAFIELFVPSILSFPDTLPQLLTEIIPATGAPQIAAGGVVIHAGVSATVAPGSLIDIYGSGLPPTAVSAPAGPLPFTLGGAAVSIGGKAAPLIYAGPGQVIAQVPWEVTPGQAAVSITVNGVASAAANITVASAAPNILTYGSNRAVVQNADYSTNGSANGAAPGSIVTAYLIGSGPVKPAVASGTPTPSAPLSYQTLTTTATLGTVNAPVTFAGLAPGFIGVVQVNLTIPVLAPGDYPLQIKIGETASNSPLLTVSK